MTPVLGRRSWVPSLGFTPWVAPLAMVGATAFTWLLWRFGPSPTKRVDAAAIWPELAKYANHEPTDRLILLSWWFLPLVVLAIGVVVGRMRGHARSTPALVLLGLVSLGLITASVVIADDPWGYWAGLSAMSLILGVLAAVGLGWSWQILWRTSRWFSGVVVVGMVGLALPALAMTSLHLRDPYDFQFTGDELAAPAVGSLPLGGYTSQYVNLLGYPIAPVLRLAPSFASDITVGWILALQVLLIVAAISVPILVSGRRMLAGATVVVLAPLIMAGANSPQTPLSYFATVPLRTVLPVVFISVSLIVLPRVVASERPGRLLLVWGAGLGVVALNNADFGLPLVIVAVGALVIVSDSIRQFGARAAATLAAAVAVAVAYGLVLLTLGTEPDPAAYLRYARTFAIDGFYQVPMQPFGPHVAAVALFVSGVVVGPVLTWTARSQRSAHRLRMGLALFMAGGWGLLTMAYFAGRSFMPTFIGGTVVQIGLTAAAFLPLLRVTWRRTAMLQWTQRIRLSVPSIFGVIMVGVAVALLSYARLPKDALTDVIDAAPGRASVVNADVITALNTWQAATNDDARTSLVQLFPNSHLTQLETGLQSGMPLNHPEALGISPVFTALQCSSLADEQASAVVVSAQFAEFLRRDPLCGSILAWERAVNVDVSGTDRSLTIVPLQAG